MKVIYPYNEILPKKSAHDVFIFDECAALAQEGIDTTLLCGKGSLNDKDLFDHYRVPLKTFHIERLPIVRKNNPLNLSWNLPFFLTSQTHIRRTKPNWVILSVRKQGMYHLHRKLPHTRYLYEVHQLTYYPYMKKPPPSFHAEHKMLMQADLITVTTHALKEILLDHPYSLTTPIEVVPLAVKKEPLPPPPDKPFTLMYIGQLYTGQGIHDLLSACALVEGVQLKIVGGKPHEIENLRKLAPNAEFLGFIPPSELSEIAKEAHAFVAPFDSSERMPYVAHTKLYEYAHWGRPFIAPDLPTVREHFSESSGALLYEPENISALAACIRSLKNDETRMRLQKGIATHFGKYSWKARASRYHNLFTEYS